MPNPTNLVWNGWTLNADVSRLLLLGGDAGATGSQKTCYSWNLVNNPPVLTQLSAQLPYPCESAVVGIDANGNAWVYSGAVYASSNGANAVQYDHGVLQFAVPRKLLPLSVVVVVRLTDTQCIPQPFSSIKTACSPKHARNSI